jgi:hypothetical protein
VSGCPLRPPFNAQIVILVALFSIAYCNDLNCYDCDPKSEGRCVTPDVDNVKVTNCRDLEVSKGVKKQISDVDQQEIESRISNITEAVSQCFSLYMETGENDSGVYRGCIKTAKDILNACEFLAENLPNSGNITTCRVCSEDRCNVDDVGGGAAALTLSLGIVILNLIVCINVFNI